jgi:hypothetical protein
MSAQQQTFAEMDQPTRSPRPKGDPEPAPVWLQRVSLVVLVLFCFLVGWLMLTFPWSPRFWDHNAWLLAHPAVLAVLSQGWVRGLISGIGLIDVWIGVSELLHYRDYRG